MTTAEMISNKFSELLGGQYKIMPNDCFNRDYTQEIATMQGISVDFYKQAFEQDNDFIIGCVSTIPQQLVNTPYKLVLENFTLQFWVPVNYIKRNRQGNLLEKPKFDFYGDLERLQRQIRAKELTFLNGDKKYKAFITISEPSLVSSKVEYASISRVCYQITGTINLCDFNVGTGNDLKIVFVINGNESEIRYPLSFSIGAPTQSNALNYQGSISVKQDVAASSHDMQFSLDDYLETDAELLIKEKAWKNIDILSPNANSENKKRKVLTRLYLKNELVNEFWGILSAEYSNSGKFSFATYNVTLSNDCKGV